MGFVEIRQTFVKVDVVLLNTADPLLLCRYSAGGTSVIASLTVHTIIVHSKFLGFIRNQG